jgi:hypothetical protein
VYERKSREHESMRKRSGSGSEVSGTQRERVKL